MNVTSVYCACVRYCLYYSEISSVMCVSMLFMFVHLYFRYWMDYRCVLLEHGVKCRDIRSGVVLRL